MAHKNLVVDMDDVLVNISQKWARKATLSPGLRRLATVAALPASNAELGAAVRARDRAWLQDWLGLMGEPGLMAEFDALYRGDGAFYDDLPPTPFAVGVIRALIPLGVVGAVHVVTHTMGDGDPVNDSKRRWLSRHLPDDRVQVHLVDGGTKKSEVIRRHCPDADTYADDSMKNVIDVLTARGVHAHEIAMPKLGCNHPMPDAVAIAARLARTKLNYYEVVHSPEEDAG
jgi:hypothetical protein